MPPISEFDRTVLSGKFVSGMRCSKNSVVNGMIPIHLILSMAGTFFSDFAAEAAEAVYFSTLFQAAFNNQLSSLAFPEAFSKKIYPQDLGFSFMYSQLA